MNDKHQNQYKVFSKIQKNKDKANQKRKQKWALLTEDEKKERVRKMQEGRIKAKNQQNAIGTPQNTGKKLLYKDLLVRLKSSGYEPVSREEYQKMLAFLFNLSEKEVEDYKTNTMTPYFLRLLLEDIQDPQKRMMIYPDIRNFAFGTARQINESNINLNANINIDFNNLPKTIEIEGVIVNTDAMLMELNKYIQIEE